MDDRRLFPRNKGYGGVPESRRLRLAKCLLALVWLAIIAICLLHKDEFTLEGILNYTPRQPALAVLLLWALFAVKSLSIFLYSGLLYAAGGIPAVQAELAKRSQVSLRSIQMYEQRNKDINKASAETVLRLSRVLGCTMEDLLEK